MEFELKIKVGEQEITIKEEADDHTDLFSKLAFFSTLPKVGPNGGTNLRFVHRTPNGFDYYSIVDEDAKMELKFGVSKERPGCLFIKQWEPMYFGENQETKVQAPAPKAPAPKAPAPKAPVQKVTLPKAVQVQAPQAQVQAPVEQDNTPAPNTNAAPNTNSAVQNVLAKYGLNK